MPVRGSVSYSYDEGKFVHAYVRRFAHAISFGIMRTERERERERERDRDTER